jgi:hypothetical protein
LAKTVLTDEERRYLKLVALELADIRKLLNELAETMVKLSDKDLMKALNANTDGPTEKQVDNYKLALEKQVDAAKSDF